MLNTFTPILGPTHTITCASKLIMTGVVSALASNGGDLFVVMPTFNEYESIVRVDQRRTLDAAFMAASHLLTSSMPFVAEDVHLEQAYEDRVCGTET